MMMVLLVSGGAASTPCQAYHAAVNGRPDDAASTAGTQQQRPQRDPNPHYTIKACSLMIKAASVNHIFTMFLPALCVFRHSHVTVYSQMTKRSRQ
jgi:hypothetical protein